MVRNGNTEELTVAVGRPQEDRRSGNSDLQDSDRTSKRLGLSLVPIPDAARKQLGMDTTGLMVDDVEPGSPAAENGIQPGDVITTVNNREVHQPSDVAEARTNARRENRPVLLRVKRDGQSLFVAVS
ncbi:PDZ domain-containing protein (plasmid) [Bradyrhizobium lupini]|uniref:PDZ domain-containing protein n=1 Tax=Rhizobium lupini TaxID=136996 RepID=UPI003671BF2F